MHGEPQGALPGLLPGLLPPGFLAPLMGDWIRTDRGVVLTTQGAGAGVTVGPPFRG